MSFNKLVFDTADAGSIEDSANVGAYLRASDGTLLTHTDISGKKALDVNVASGINVEVDLSHIDDSVALGNGTDLYTSTTVAADIGLDVYLINASLAVTATDFDIRDLAFATDKVDVSGSTILGITNDVNIADGGNSITVDAVDFDIRDLAAATDSVASWTNDGAGNAIGSTTGSLNVHVTGSDPLTINDSALADTAIAHSQQSAAAADTAEDTVDSILANRKYLFLQNSGNKDIFIGGAGVLITTGFPISPGSYVELRAGAAVDVQFASKATTGSDLRALELS